MIMSMTYRYIFLLLDIVAKMLFSRKSRTVGRESSISSWKLNAGIVGALFLKSYDMSEALYLAMLSRGFNGTVSSKHSDPDNDNGAGFKSYLFVTVISLFCISSLLMEVI